MSIDWPAFIAWLSSKILECAAQSRIRIGILVLSFFLIPVPGFADKKSEDSTEQICEALVDSELQVDRAGRDNYLAEAIKRNPQDARLRWHSGAIRIDRKWTDVQKIIPSTRQSERWQAYVDRRDQTPDTVAGQLALANWCRRQQLPQQERAHLQRVIEFEPDHREARTRLGFVERGSRWIEARSFWQGENDAMRMEQAVQRWNKKIRGIAKGLRDSNPRREEAANARLVEITDPDAIYAIERIMGYGNTVQARLAIDKISEFPQREASLALARLAILSDSPLNRQLAAHAMRYRRQDDYVPALINELSKPIESRFVAMEVNGRVEYRHTFAREQRDQTDIDIRDLSLQPEAGNLRGNLASNGRAVIISRPTNQVDAESRLRAIATVSQTMADREQEKEIRNSQIRELNLRITTALAMATEQELNPDPSYWWNWWDQANDVYQSGSKPERTYYVSSSETYQTPSILDSPARSPSARHECFVAGTPVLTWMGPIAIDKIQRGDLVVSQDPETGELAIRPVLATSIRPSDEILRIAMANGEIVSSPGHPYWISGAGWKLAKNIRHGDVIHGLRGGLRVESIEPGDAQVTYNLVVDQFHTYFVGEAKLLVHDNTEVRATNRKLPGF